MGMSGNIRAMLHHLERASRASRTIHHTHWTGRTTCMVANAGESMGMPDGLFYWIPGEMVVVVRLHRHPAPETQELLVEQVRGQLNALLSQYGMVVDPYGSAGRWRKGTAAAKLRRSFIFGRHRQQPLIAMFFHVRQ